MQSKAKQRAKQDTAEEWQPPRGIRFYEDHGRPAPYYVQWADPDRTPVNGRRPKKTLSFPDAAKRLEFAKGLARDLSIHGQAAFRAADPAEVSTWKRFREIVGADVDPLVVAVEWKQLRNATSATGSGKKVRDAVTEYLAMRKAEGISVGNVAHQKTQLGVHFIERFGSMAVGEVSGDMIRDWLASIVSHKTGLPISKETQIDYRKNVNAFFERARIEKWVRENPCESVMRPKVKQKPVELLTVKETFELFKANAGRPLIGRLALEAFAGFRYSSAARATKADINFEDRGLSLPGDQLKTERRKYVEGHPGTLWGWLALAADDCWTLTERQYLEEKGDAFIRANVENPGNALRKGFCSYHMAVHRNAVTTAYLLQHEKPKKLYESYFGIATKREGLLYFLITPDAVRMTWEDFLESPMVHTAMDALKKEKLPIASNIPPTV